MTCSPSVTVKKEALRTKRVRTAMRAAKVERRAFIYCGLRRDEDGGEGEEEDEDEDEDEEEESEASGRRRGLLGWLCRGG